MVCSYQATFQLFITIISGFAFTQGCPIVCSNGGTPLDSCRSCRCTEQWSGPYCSHPCGGRISSLVGRISSPGYPNNYENYENCTWIVIVPEDSTIVISFEAMDLERCCDFILVHGGTTLDSELVGKYTGDVLPYEMTMETSFLLAFVSDGSVTRKGFSLRFQTYEGLSPKFASSSPETHAAIAVRVGDKITLRCDAVAVPVPTITWRKDGDELVDSSSTSFYVHGQSLVSVNVKVSDAAWYTCEAGNYLGTIRRSYQLIVQAPPSIIHSPTSIYFDRLNDYQQAVFRCDAFGIPKPQITWKKDGSSLNLANYQFVEGTRWLKIRSVTLGDIGNYSCCANNTLGDVESNPAVLAILNTTAPPYRFYGPYLYYESGTVVVNRTASFGILCYYYCFRESDFAIYRDSSILNTSTDSRVSTSAYYDYYFDYYSIQEDDTGIYEIRYLPERFSWFVAINVVVPPNVFQPTKFTIPRKFRERLTITCQSKVANPQPSYFWERNGLPVNDTWTGHTITVGYDKSYLTLNEDANQQQTSQYSCTAINAAGTSTARVDVTINIIGGWIEWNRGSQCSSSCNSIYGLLVVQRKCISVTRCIGLSVYTIMCLSLRTICPTNGKVITASPLTTTLSTNIKQHNVTYPVQTKSSGTNVNMTGTERPTTADSEQRQAENKERLSQGAVAGVSVTVTAIVVTLSFFVLWFAVNRFRRKSQHRASGVTVSANVYNNPSSSDTCYENCGSGEKNIDIGKPTQLLSLPRGTGTAAEQKHGETETEQIYATIDAPEVMHESRAYAETAIVRQTPSGNPGIELIYEDT